MAVYIIENPLLCLQKETPEIGLYTETDIIRVTYHTYSHQRLHNYESGTLIWYFNSSLVNLDASHLYDILLVVCAVIQDHNRVSKYSCLHVRGRKINRLRCKEDQSNPTK